MTAKAFEILTVLIDHRQRVVDKDELLESSGRRRPSKKTR